MSDVRTELDAPPPPEPEVAPRPLLPRREPWRGPTAGERIGAPLGLLVLCALLFWLRTSHLDYLLPHLQEPDNYAVLQVEQLRERAAGSTDPAPFQFYFYPMLLARLHLALPEEPPPPVVAPGEAELPAQLAAASRTVVRSRSIVAWLSLLIAPATYLIAVRFVRPWTALFAAALAGTSFLHLQFSGQARPHGMAAGFIPLAVAAALWMRRRPTPLTYVAAGVAAALAVCSLQNGSAALLTLPVAHVLRDRTRERGGWWKLLLPIAVVAAAALYLYPFLVERAPVDTTQSYSGFRIEKGVLKGLGHEIPLALFAGKGFPKLVELLSWNDPMLLWGGLGGIVFGLLLLAVRRGRMEAGLRRDLWVLLAHAVPYTLMLGLYGKTFDRYLLPLVPPLALATAFAVGWVVQTVTRLITPSVWQRILFGSPVVAAVLAVPLRYDLHLVSLRGAPDTFELAARWLTESAAPEDQVVTGPGMLLPLFVREDELPPLNPQRIDDRWLEYQLRWSSEWPEAPRLRVRDPFVDAAGLSEATVRRLSTADGASAFLTDLAPDWVILEISPRTRNVLKGAGMDNLRQALFAHGKLVERILPSSARRGTFYYYQDVKEFGDLLLRTKHLGPEIEIWHLEHP